MKILVIGGGGREHALCWRLAKDAHQVYALPGSAGIAAVAQCFEGEVNDAARALEVATLVEAALVVIGPEIPLVAGLADALRAAGFAVFGPGAVAAQLEGSKAFSKRFFEKHGIRTAAYVECADMPAAEQAIASLGGQVVVKADGLAAGKGVVVCDSADEAREAARSMLEDGRFADAGTRIIIEARITGREVSMMALCDGKRYELLAQAEDHKAIFDGDKGPNTGGMGTVSPVAWVSDDLVQRAGREIFDPTLAGLLAEGLDFRGVLYAGLMVDGDGTPWLLEYNVRFGDPETQPVMARLSSDLGAWLWGAANGEMPAGHLEWDPQTAVCVVLASAGYPESASKGDVINGVQEAEAMPGITVFYAGCRRDGQELVTNGGRVLAVTGLGPNLTEARAKTYAAVEQIDFAGMQFRRDIGKRGQENG